jgi:hypothetical protein
MRNFLRHEQRRASNFFSGRRIVTDNFSAGRLSGKGLGHKRIIA